jgi:uncharacterized protein
MLHRGIGLASVAERNEVGNCKENSYIKAMEDFLHSFLNHYQGSYTKLVIDETLILLGNLWPYIVAGILTTTLIKVFLSKSWISSFFLKNRNLSVLLAAALGVATPLGSYVVIPLAAALFSLGVPLPVLMALMVSAPLIDPTLFILTAGAFGLPFAMVRLFSALLLGLAAGYGTAAMMRIKLFGTLNSIPPQEKPELKTPDLSGKGRGLQNFGRELYKMTIFISRYFFLAILLAALIKILTPTHFLSGLFGQNSFMTVILTTAAGIPFYVCGGASIPVIQQLADLGMSQGAALAFFISGPITKVSNLILMRASFTLRIFVLYILIGLVGALLFGLLYNLLF